MFICNNEHSLGYKYKTNHVSKSVRNYFQAGKWRKVCWARALWPKGSGPAHLPRPPHEEITSGRFVLLLVLFYSLHSLTIAHVQTLVRDCILIISWDNGNYSRARNSRGGKLKFIFIFTTTCQNNQTFIHPHVKDTQYFQAYIKVEQKIWHRRIHNRERTE